jgi:hypothetical protein
MGFAIVLHPEEDAGMNRAEEHQALRNILKKLSLAALIFCTSTASTSADETYMRLMTWGAPWTPSFEVIIGTDGALAASKLDPQLTEPLAAHIQLSAEDTAALLSLAEKAVKQSEIESKCDKVYDGTSGSLEVWIGSQQFRRKCIATSRWPPQGTLAESLLKRINEKLPKTIQVY